MNAIEMILTLGKMGYSKSDVERMIAQPQPQGYDMLKLFTSGQPQPQSQTQPPTPTGIEEQLKALTQAIQLNNVNTMANQKTLPVTSDDVLASIINPPVNIPDNTLK